MGRRASLTIQTAETLEFHWQLVGDKMTDEQVCDKAGISFGQLRGWLQRNTRPIGPDGKEQAVGLRDIRARAKAAVMVGYLVDLHRDLRDARAVGNHKVTTNVLMWLLEKHFPTQFGNRIETEADKQKQQATGVIISPGTQPGEVWPIDRSHEQRGS